MKARLLATWKWLHSTLGRGLAGVGAFAALAWFLWPETQWHVHPDALAALVIATVSWIGSLTPIEPQKASKHDLELFAKFRALFSEGEKYFLRTHDFGGSFSWHQLDGTQTLAREWEGAEYQFDDDELQPKFATLINDAVELISRMSLGTWVIEAKDKWASAIPEMERDGHWSPKTEKRIKDYNERATKLIDDIDKFIRCTRKRLDE